MCRIHLAAVAGLLSVTLSGQTPFTSPSVLATPGTPSQTLYASHNGLFKSTDLGATWNPFYLTEPGLPQPTPIAFVIDPANESILYLATTAAHGLFWKSTDAGATWALANTGLPASGADDPTYLQLNPSNRALYLLLGGRLYKSSDNASSWTTQSIMPGGSSSFDICPTSPSRMYYGQYEGIYRSDDEGRNWKFLSYVIPVPSPVPFNRTGVNEIAVDYNNPALILVSIGGPTTSNNGLYRNTNAGEGAFDRLPVSYVVRFYTGPTSPIYAHSGTGGTMRSTNQGATWTYLSLSTSLTAVDPNARNTVYGIGTPSAFIRSTDAGNNWSSIAATVRPTLSKESAPLTAKVEVGSTASVTLRVQALEISSAAIPFTATTSGEPWLSLNTSSGTAPNNLTVQLSTAGLTPGNYTASIRISSSATANPSVEIPVQFTVVPRDEGRPEFLISTVPGSVNGVSLPSYLALDGSNNLYVAQSSRKVWRIPLPDGNPILVAGNANSAVAATGDPPRMPN